jgi:hypothetical protein
VVEAELQAMLNTPTQNITSKIHLEMEEVLEKMNGRDYFESNSGQ